MAEIINGPSRIADGTMNLVGAIRKSISICGYTDVKEFQRVEIITN
jgi:IMP dehydrogenase